MQAAMLKNLEMPSKNPTSVRLPPKGMEIYHKYHADGLQTIITAGLYLYDRASKDDRDAVRQEAHADIVRDRATARAEGLAKGTRKRPGRRRGGATDGL